LGWGLNFNAKKIQRVSGLDFFIFGMSRWDEIEVLFLLKGKP
jgi:hypothetical protein